MQAGKMDRRITLMRRTLTQNAQGEQVPTWAAYDTVWAQKLDGAGRESFVAQTVYADADFRFRIRYRSDVLQTDRAVFEGISYDILTTSEIGRREGLELFCRGVQP